MKRINLTQCPCCKGEKTYPLVAKILDSTGWHDAPVVNMPCHICKETGKIDPVEYAEQQKAKDEFWCSCENSTGVTFIDDGLSPRCLKHHYVCNDCGKVQQVG